MKHFTLALVCLLLVGMWLQAVTSKSLHVSSSKCCFKFVKGKMSLKKINCYKHSSPSCSYRDGIIFEMRAGREICALKTDKWVADNLQKIKPCPLKET